MRGKSGGLARGHVVNGAESTERDSLHSLGVAQRFHQVEPAAVWQPEIANKQIEPSCPGQTARFRDGARVAEIESGVPQNPAQHARGILVVFDEQNLDMLQPRRLALEKKGRTFEQGSLHRVQRHREFRAASFAFALRLDRAAVEIDHAFANGEAESEPAVFTRDSTAALFERIEYSWH